MTERIVHPIPPLYDARSRILILGSFPSVKSREAAFFYGHPQNRFWRVIAAVLECPVPVTVPEKAAMLHAHHIALWDTIASCEIEGSSDSSIQNVVPNDLTPILSAADIQAVFCNGAASYRLYCRYLEPLTGLTAAKLPSTSPANAAFSPERLIEQYDVRSGQGPVTIARSMSGGNQQKAIVAREIDKDPELLVAVQPTRGLDVGAIEYIHRQLVAQRDEGKAVLLVSLELDEVMDVPDRILVMYEGEIVGELDPKTTTQEELGLYMAGAKRDEVKA